MSAGRRGGAGPQGAAAPPTIGRAGPAMGILWAFLMLVWLAGLVSGLGWVWPHVARMALTADLVIGLMWLIIGAAAWVVALNFGLQRYWPPGRRPRRS